MLSDSELATRVGIPVSIVRAIRAVESGGSPSAVRFETRLFRERTGRTIEGHDRAAFERARAIDAEAAIRSTSWGLYQVLGGHLLRVRPENPVAAFDADPRGVSDELFVSWFRASPRAVAAAQAGNIEALAELYNGSQRWAVAVRRALAAQGGGAVATGLGLGTLFFAGAVSLGVYLWRKR